MFPINICWRLFHKCNSDILEPSPFWNSFRYSGNSDKWEPSIRRDWSTPIIFFFCVTQLVGNQISSLRYPVRSFVIYKRENKSMSFIFIEWSSQWSFVSKWIPNNCKIAILVCSERKYQKNHIWIFLQMSPAVNTFAFFTKMRFMHELLFNVKFAGIVLYVYFL